MPTCRSSPAGRRRQVRRHGCGLRVAGLGVGALDPIRSANLRWLAGYRHLRHRLDATAARLADVFTDATPLVVGAEVVGDPGAVLPVLFHLLWCQDLSIDLAVPLHAGSCVRVAGAGR